MAAERIKAANARWEGLPDKVPSASNPFRQAPAHSRRVAFESQGGLGPFSTLDSAPESKMLRQTHDNLRLQFSITNWKRDFEQELADLQQSLVDIATLDPKERADAKKQAYRDELKWVDGYGDPALSARTRRVLAYVEKFYPEYIDDKMLSPYRREPVHPDLSELHFERNACQGEKEKLQELFRGIAKNKKIPLEEKKTLVAGHLRELDASPDDAFLAKHARQFLRELGKTNPGLIEEGFLKSPPPSP